MEMIEPAMQISEKTLKQKEQQAQKRWGNVHLVYSMNSKDGWSTQQVKKRIVRSEVRAVMGKKQRSQKSG